MITYIIILILIGLNITSCARLFNLEPRTLYYAQQKEERVMTNMRLPPVPRDKLENQYDLLMKYFTSIPPKSGKLKILYYR